MAWKIIHESWFFPHGDLIKAKKGGKASETWARLLEGRDVMLQGAVWQINCGECIKVWEDSWIPGLDGHKLNGRGRKAINRDLCVENLHLWRQDKKANIICTFTK